MHVTSIYFRD